MAVSVSAEEIKHGLGVGLWLLDIRDMRGIEADELGALDLLLDCFAGRRRRCRILFADDHQSRRRHARIG